MIDTDKMIRAKSALLEKFKKLTPRVDLNHARLPPGQHLTKGFPVLDLGIRPKFDPAVWRFRVAGDVEKPVSLSWAEFTGLPKAEQVCDFHCVTTWSKYDVRWGGVKFSTVVELARPKASARYLVMDCADGYTTNLPLSELTGSDILLAYELDGEPLPLEHGGPMRMIVPHIYAWKSAKFMIGFRFMDHDEKGYWEVRGYHNHADPWKEERFG